MFTHWLQTLFAGKLDEAMTCFRTALDMRLRISRGETNSAPVQNVLLSMGVLHHQRGDFWAALEAYKEVFAFRKVHYGASHPNAVVIKELVKFVSSN